MQVEMDKWRWNFAIMKGKHSLDTHREVVGEREGVVKSENRVDRWTFFQFHSKLNPYF